MKKYNSVFVIAIVISVIYFIQIYPLANLKKSLEDKFIDMNISSEIMLRQGLNQCGPFAAMAVINILNDKIYKIDEFNSTVKFRFKNGMTLPFGITDRLHDEGIDAKIRMLQYMSANNRIKYLKNQISKNKPIIMLNSTKEGIDHYFTVLGYENDSFYIYDSLQVLDPNQDGRNTIDANGDQKAGNLTLSKNELLERWGTASYFPAKWLIIECSSRNR